jgi:regulator of RNase E activity RraA
MPTLDQKVLDQLRRFDTPTICNVIELFEVRPRTAGYMDARIQACFPDLPPMVGYAATASFRSSAPPRGGDGYAGIEDQVERFGELDGPPVLVFQDLDSPSTAATFGEVMCSTYQAFGAVGIITSGTGRDLDQVRAIGFPAFTGGAVCSHGYNHVLHIHAPVHIGGIVVAPNDLLHGDRNGVTTIPAAIAAEVADLCAPFVAAEQIILDAVRAQSPTVARLREARAEAHSRMAALRAQVSRAQPR